MPASDRLPAPADRILEETRLKIAIARQHLNDLGEFGLTSAWLDDLESQTNEAETFTTYTRQREELKALTTAKDAALADCIQWGRRLRLRLELAFEDRPASGPQFPARDWRESERSETRLIALFPNLLELARQQAFALAPVGQTDADLADGERRFAALKQANEAQEQYKLTRTSVTAQRCERFAQLYNSVNRINKIGQTVFGDDPSTAVLFRSNWQQGETPSEATPVAAE